MDTQMANKIWDIADQINTLVISAHVDGKINTEVAEPIARLAKRIKEISVK